MSAHSCHGCVATRMSASPACSTCILAGSNGAVVEVPCERLLALVPWADSLNHCSTATERSVLQYDASADAAVLFAHRDYAAGDEVFESYGTWLTPSELLLDYGFVDEKNKTNAITVCWPLRTCQTVHLPASLTHGSSADFQEADPPALPHFQEMFRQCSEGPQLCAGAGDRHC